jgi:hypothetical protein
MKLEIVNYGTVEIFTDSLDYAFIIGKKTIEANEDWFNYITIYIR